MNGTEQRLHRTAVQTLAKQTDERIDAICTTFDGALAILEAKLRDGVNQERTHRLDLAKEQRSYVDGALAELRRSTVASDDYLGARLRRLESLTFWHRLWWLLSGRLPEGK